MTTLPFSPPLPREPRTPRYTPDDLLIMPEGERYELVNGQLVEKPMSGLSSWVGGKVVRRIGNFVDEHHLGYVFGSDCGFQCFPDAPMKVRKPDASFVARHRLPQGLTDGHVRVPPDLAVEVASPNDSFRDVDEKVEEYLAAGVRSVWLINPRLRVLQVFRPNAHGLRLHDNDELREPEILPGFVCRVGDLLPPVSAPETSDTTREAEAVMPPASS